MLIQNILKIGDDYISCPYCGEDVDYSDNNTVCDCCGYDMDNYNSLDTSLNTCDIYDQSEWDGWWEDWKEFEKISHERAI